MFSFASTFTFALLMIAGSNSFETAPHDNAWGSSTHLKGQFGARTSRLLKGETEYAYPSRYAHSKERIIDILEGDDCKATRKYKPLVYDDEFLNVHNELSYDRKYQKSAKQFKSGDNHNRKFGALNKSDDLNSLYDSSESVNDDVYNSFDDLKSDIAYDDSSDDLRANNYFEPMYMQRRKKGFLEKVFHEGTKLEIVEDSSIVNFVKKIDSKVESEILRFLKSENKHYQSKHRPENSSSSLERYKIFMPFVVNVFIIVLCALNGAIPGVIIFQILGVVMALYYKRKKDKCHKFLKRSKNVSRKRR
ncbi:Pv-fam-d protein [Plasmodium vivax Brazil I]|uniref:Pv-fam-d protein n=1 Tax=Plasmodium vivax (strain Brazil I) TaxID=1033975 RepID=A0A0J9SPI0_PLAV1|nr:Pv-fam-d protein [Plasmodium vivax Brazil I]